MTWKRDKTGDLRRIFPGCLQQLMMDWFVPLLFVSGFRQGRVVGVGGADTVTQSEVRASTREGVKV